MQYRNVFALVLILFVYFQVATHLRILPLFLSTEIQRKVGGFLNNRDAAVKPNGPMYEACNMCVWGSCTPAIKPRLDSEFHEEEDARRLVKALSGFLLDRDTVTNILTSRSESQRRLISDSMKTNGGLAAMLTSRIDGTRHMLLMQALATPLTDFYVNQFQLAIKSQNDKEKSKKGRIFMLETFTSLSPCLIGKIIRAYDLKNRPNRFVTDIVSSLKGFPQSDYIDVFKILAEGHRDENINTSWLKAYNDAKRMKQAIEIQHYQNTKEVFREVFTKRSIPQLKETFIVYEYLRQGAKGFKSLHDDINTNMENVKEIYASIVKIVQNQPLYFASIFETIFETYSNKKVDSFINLIRARCDIDLGDIKEAYDKTYKKSLVTRFVEVANPNGHFYEAVLKIIK